MQPKLKVLESMRIPEMFQFTDEQLEILKNRDGKTSPTIDFEFVNDIEQLLDFIITENHVLVDHRSNPYKEDLRLNPIELLDELILFYRVLYLRAVKVMGKSYVINYNPHIKSLLKNRFRKLGEIALLDYKKALLESTTPIECKRCNTLKMRSEFSTHRYKKNGLHSFCKKCISENTKKWHSERTPQEKRDFIKIKDLRRKIRSLTDIHAKP